jgi:hypothetical protein
MNLSVAMVPYALSLKTITASRAVSLPLAMVPYSLTLEAVTLTYTPSSTAYSLSLATVSYGLTIEGTTLTYVSANGPAQVPETPAGGPVRAIQYIIKIDGKEFVTPSLASAIDLLNEAKALAKRHALDIARAATEKSAEKPKIKLPKITGSAPVRELVLEVRKEIKAIYESALRDAEIAMFMELAKRSDEEEDTFLLML